MSDVTLPGGSNWLVKGIRTNWITIVIFIVLLVALAIFVPAFYQPANLLNVARQSSIVGVVAIGMTFVILTGGIDLSVGSILALSGVAMAMLINQGMVPGVAILIALLVGVATGIVNGIVVAVLKIQPFIATLASMVAITGLALRLTNGGPQPFNNIGDVFNFLGSGNVFGLPGPFLVFLIVAVIGILVLRYLPFGRFLYAIGGSPEAARLTGVPTRRTLVMAYAVSGLTAALAGVMTASRLGVGAPTAGGLANLDAITAVVIGGTSLMGGTGGAAGTVFGALLLAVLSNLMNLIGISPFDQQIVKGVVIVLAVLLAMQATRKRISDRRGKLGRSGSAGDSPSQ
ncbi:MAG TPA: ABC transporter permease [Rhodoglobus sp.]|jgi:ribose transport system permease protein|nr:ABC transporter permease [Rhodoglobus sp.]HPG76400.1 ABC transporter permease [Rhodoglobus sp.]